MTDTFVQNLIAIASAGCGAAFAALAAVSHRQLCALISFAAGTLLAAAIFHIVPEAWGKLPPPAVFLALASGYVLFHLLRRYVFHV